MSTLQPRDFKTSANPNSGADPYPPPTRSAFTGAVGIPKAVPSGATISTSAPSGCAHSHLEPVPCGATINSIVPPKLTLSATLEIAKALRKIIRDESPPTLIATKFPGRQDLTKSPIPKTI